ncbi:MAG: hypothetical protein KAS71_09085, partial [Bacteroidales bacterium]|nr:hypothetical protein [Bacteroidales bacterium]
WDYSLYSEGMISIMGEQDTTAIISLKQIAEKVPMDTVLMSVKEYVNSLENDVTISSKITPHEMADSIESFCIRAIEMVSHIETAGNIDLQYEKTDILTWANLGLYFAYKLRSAVAYRQFESTCESDYHAQAVTYLEKATKCWEKVSLQTSDMYKVVPLQHYNRNKDKYFHWKKVFKEVQAELEWLKNELQAKY